MTAPRGAAVVLASVLVALSALSTSVSPGYAAAPGAWAPSSALLLSEIATGGATASDEFVELYNAGRATADLGGCELAYVTASGATVTRKAAFGAPLALDPGQHLLVANSAGAYAATADATYSGGLAADGGTLVLRRADGSVIDAVSWGTALNSYAEGSVAPAPPAGSSLERRPGSPLGNWADTNDNAADWFVQPHPNPRSTAATPEPTAGTPEPTAEPTAWTPEPTSGATASAEPTAGTPEPTLEPSATPSVGPSAAPSSEPSASSPDPSASGAAIEPIGQVRQQAPGTRVHVAGIVSASPGLTGSDVLFAIADTSGGIFVRLPSTAGLRIGQPAEAIGILAAPYGQLEIRELELLALGPEGPAPIPTPAAVADVGEGLEGSLVSIEGVIDSVQGQDGRLALEVVDGDSSVRVLADPLTGISKADVARGERVRLSGIVGQHATAAGRLDGYKLWLRCRNDLVVLSVAPGQPTSPPASGPTSPTTPTPTPVPVYGTLASGLAVRGRIVDVAATVTAAVGLIDWGGRTIVVDDGTAAVAVVLPAASPSPKVGDRVHLAGKVGSLNNGRRVVATVVEPLDGGAALAPAPLARSTGSQDEWRLVSVLGRIERVTRAGQRWRADLDVAGHAVAVLGQPSARVSAEGLMSGRLMWAAGIVRRSLSDSDQFYLLPRGEADVRLGAPVATPPSGIGTAETGGAPGVGLLAGRLTSIADLGGLVGGEVVVAGLVVEVRAGEAVLDDGTGRVRLGGDAAADALSLLEPGDAIEVAGTLAEDSSGLLIAVDPERILAVAGAGAGEAAGQSAAEVPGASAAPTSEAFAADASPVLANAGAMVIGSGGADGRSPIPAALAVAAAGVALAVAVLGALAVAALAVPGARRRLRNPHLGSPCGPLRRRRSP